MSTISPPAQTYALQLAVGGMTCVACSRAITDAVSEISGVTDIVVNQLGKCASAVIVRKELAEDVRNMIEDIGYECTIVGIVAIGAAKMSKGTTRSVAVEFRGLGTVPSDASDVLHKLSLTSLSPLTIEAPNQQDPANVLRFSYTPSAPNFTIRTIIKALSNTLPTSPISRILLWHPPSSDDMARSMYRKEQRNLLQRLVVAVLACIPILIIGIVYMSLVKKDNPGRRYFEERIWAGQVMRGEWALFILATPVMFYSAMDFHRRSLKELWHLWKPGSQASWATRFLRFGSMNLLISLGVSVAYFSSVAELAIAATDVHGTHEADGSMTYFDSVGFLSMFLLIGKYIEAFSKHQAANAITLLSGLRSSDALLVTSNEEYEKASPSPTSSESLTQDGLKSESVGSSEETSDPTTSHYPRGVEKISVDMLEVGDIVRVPPGATPPADGIIVSSDSTFFDESSLTGESKDVVKARGDQIFVGTINRLRAVDMRVEALDGGTMLEQVIEAVREGQTKRAPVERVVDIVTSYFVPVVTALAIITWVVWLSLGLGGVLDPEVIANSAGGWPYWTLEFAISVFVIACPCGIGLAAPTALLVGSGLAAKHGILARGGGEAFQEASQIDVVVFDKTGTLTEGTEPKVTDQMICSSEHDSLISALITRLASASSHPLCVSLRRYYQNVPSVPIDGNDIEELPGCGMKGKFVIQRPHSATHNVEAFLGNETWLRSYDAIPSEEESQFLHRVKSEGKSVVLLCTRTQETAAMRLAAIFAIADPIRHEVPAVIRQLHAQKIETWMISGDNEITARAVARTIGIPSENVIAGVLPQQKADKIRWLQTLPRTGRGKSKRTRTESSRQIVAMVGDGINDAPALTAADVGVAMGSGSDIALSSAKFVLLSSDLRTLLILTDLSRKIFRRIKFNFAWATVYNLIALPVAAGVIYPAGHARLSPVWSSLAMALSSTSVVCSSLLLRLYKKPRQESCGDALSSTEESGKPGV
ncbi:Copper-transporting ATPase RAN1 [Psilocybe cubensis]|uniref:Copper-transporting ATPase RAN1 n=2 Tax=Psilocybe cubensis TaxID=181762 RepID=A0ACB8GT44_PSICU|nr:Copper-transporting ATPase RAN1 [Psilocybe cubensis]KAH9478189.1 Copper-transporting ATPase RAN1 [Psilocybe cubensis]